MITRDQAIERSAIFIDQHIDEAMATMHDMLVSRGATEQERRREISQYSVQLAEWRAKTLDDLRKWIDRGGETLN